MTGCHGTLGPTGLSGSSWTWLSRTPSYTSQSFPEPAIQTHLQQHFASCTPCHSLQLPSEPCSACGSACMWLWNTFSAQSPTLASSLELVVVARLPARIPAAFGWGRGVIPSLGFLEYDTRISTLAWWSFWISTLATLYNTTESILKDKLQSEQLKFPEHWN